MNLHALRFLLMASTLGEGSEGVRLLPPVAPPPPPEKPLTGPISRACPRCGAAVGKGCNREGSYRLSSKHRFHKSRMDK